MCSDVMVQHCPRPLAPASAENLYLNSIKMSQMIPKDQKHIICTMMMNEENFTAATRQNNSCSEDKINSE